MKALSIRQPWAWLIVNGFKDVENRGWKTSHRGPLLIHASQSMDWGAFGSLPKDVALKIPAAKDLPRGGIVGSVDLFACVVQGQYESEWFTGDYGFVLKDPVPYDLIPMKGQLGIFSVELAHMRLMKLISVKIEQPKCQHKDWVRLNTKKYGDIYLCLDCRQVQSGKPHDLSPDEIEALVEFAKLMREKTAQVRAEGEDHGSTEKHREHGGVVPDQEERGEEEGIAPADA